MHLSFLNSISDILFYYTVSIVTAIPVLANNPSCFAPDMVSNETSIVIDECDCPPLIINSNVEVTVSNITELEEALDQAYNDNGDMTITVMAGTYLLSSNLRAISANMSNLSIIGATGNADDVVIIGQGWDDPSVTHIFNVAADFFTVANMTIGEVYYHPIQVHSNPNDADDFLAQNVRFVDAKEQLLKVSGGGDLFADRGKIICCEFEFTAGIAYQYYTGGVDAHRSIDWIVEQCTFKGIRSPDATLAEHAIHFWKECQGTIVKANHIIDCDRGIGFGLGDSPANGHIGGLIKNNFVHTSRDVGIGLEHAPDANVYNNTVITDNYPRSIEYRFVATTNVHIANNITNGEISDRSSGSTGLLETNYETTDLSIFTDAALYDYHLASDITGIVDAGTDLAEVVMDYDCETRNIGTYDIGADEFFAGAPDLHPEIVINNQNSIGPSTLNVIVELNELLNNSTTGLVSFTIAKDAHITFSFDDTMTLLDGLALNNSEWTYDNSNPDFHVFNSSESIQASGISRVGLLMNYNPFQTDGVDNITVNILSGSGSEENEMNNSAIISLMYTH